MTHIVAVTASRSIDDLRVFQEAWDRATLRLATLLNAPTHWTFLSETKWRYGGAPGGDSLFAALFKLRYGEKWFDKHVELIRPDYTKYDNRVAPLERNTVLVEPATASIAIWQPPAPGSRKKGGTFDTICKAAAKSIPVVVEVLT